jgi:hypothetical protein
MGGKWGCWNLGFAETGDCLFVGNSEFSEELTQTSQRPAITVLSHITSHDGFGFFHFKMESFCVMPLFCAQARVIEHANAFIQDWTSGLPHTNPRG